MGGGVASRASIGDFIVDLVSEGILEIAEACSQLCQSLDLALLFNVCSYLLLCGGRVPSTMFTG